MAGGGPTPDFDTVLLIWAGVTLDGSPVTGSLSLTYNGSSPMLDEDPELPVGIYPTKLSKSIETRSIIVNDEEGVPQTKTVGYVEFRVPATNDPDILGSGGTYTLVEQLTNATGTTRTFIADKDAPDGTMWISRIMSIDPIDPDAVPSVTFGDLLQYQRKIVIDPVSTVGLADGTIIVRTA